MRILVLGAGLQGTACAFDLLETSDARVTVAEHRAHAMPGFLEPHVGGRLAVRELDARDEAAVLDAMREHDAVLSALPYYLNYPMTRLAVEAGVHFADLGGNTEIVRQQETLHEAAAAAGVSVMPDCGLAPGMVNILAAEAIRRLERVDVVRMFVGGLPQEPEPPLNYQVVYSLEGALDYYTTPSWVLRDRRPVQVDALSDVEPVEFPSPLGELEGFHTGGGISTMPWEFAGRVDRMEYKTLRYPGHAKIMWAIRELGLLATEPVTLDGVTVRPRDLFIRVVDEKLRRPDVPDLVAMKVAAEGAKGGEAAGVTFRLLDYFDRKHAISAMMRTTGFSLSITGQMLVDGRVPERGVRAAYQAMPFAPYVTELGKRGIEVREA